MFISLALNLPAFQTKLVVPEHISVQKNDNIEQLYIHCFSASSPPRYGDRRSYQVFLGVICHKTINYSYYPLL